MSDNTPNKLKLTLKKTDSSRIKTDTNRLRKVTAAAAAGGDADEPTMAVPPPRQPRAGETTSVSDPMAMRDTDTSKLRRLQLDDQGSAKSTLAGQPQSVKPVDVTSETVSLKVIREHKKPTSGLTVRLKPGSAAEMPAEETTHTKPLAKSTLKLKMPGSETVAPSEPSAARLESGKSTETMKVFPVSPKAQTDSSAETQAPSEAKSTPPLILRPSLKPATSGKTGETWKLKPIAVTDSSENSGAQTLAVPPATESTSMASDGDSFADAQDSGTARLTLKVTPRKTDIQETVRLSASAVKSGSEFDESAKKTVQVSAQNSPKKTLRLTNTPTKTQEEETIAAQAPPELEAGGNGKKSFKLRNSGNAPSQSPQRSESVQQQAAVAGNNSSNIVVTIASVAALVALTAVVTLNLLQFMQHCQ